MLLSAFLSCTDNVIDDVQFEFDGTKSKGISEDYRVKYADILALHQCQNVGTRSSSQMSTPTIECITDKSNDTILYLSKRQGGGWTMYSSDTRVPAIVAQSENGSYEQLMQIDGARLWIQSIAEDMAMIRKLPDEKLNFSQKEIANNKDFWKSVSSPDMFVKDNLLSKTRAVDKDVTKEPIIGHYECVSSYTYSEVYDSISRLTTTDWSQGMPYNIYCPLKSDNFWHAPAGCVAIAGAQMLYYLNHKFGVPATAPSEAYCNGNVDSYTWAQTNYTTSIWSSMTYNGSCAAPLIADVGRRLNMQYGDNASGAYTSDLVGNVFVPYGISCSYVEYNIGLLRNSLLDSIPVILCARSTYTTNDGTKKVGHAFIADRYKRFKTVTKNSYEWVYDSYPPLTRLPYVPGKIEYTYSSPYIGMVGFNWGWGFSCNVSTEWFSLTGDWISSQSGMSQYNWNIDRHMIYGFQVINNQ